MKYLPLLVLYFLTEALAAQVNTAGSIEATLKQARQSGRKVLLLRTEIPDPIYSRNYSYPTLKSCTDSILDAAELDASFLQHFLVYRHDVLHPRQADSSFIEQRYLFDYAPNLILLSPEGENLGYLGYMEGLDCETINLDSLLQLTLDQNAEQAVRRHQLEQKYQAQDISPEELQELLNYRAQCKQRSAPYWNYLALHRMSIPVYETDAPYLLEDFSADDAFLQYLLGQKNAFEQEKFFLIQNLKQSAYYRGDVASYHQFSFLFDSLTRTLKGDLNPLFPIDEMEKAENEQRLLELVGLYQRAGDQKMLIQSAEKYIAQILPGYDQQKQDILDSETQLISMLLPTIPPDDTSSGPVLSREDVLAYRRWELGTEIDAEYADHLNEIAWIYYESITKPRELKKALAWCKKSLELKTTSANLDTYAHLHYKLGNRKKAIEYQTQALSAARTENLQLGRLEMYEAELLRFTNN